MRIVVRLLLLGIVLSGLSSIVLAQGDKTPSPAPSKTAIPTEDASQEEEEETSTPSPTHTQESSSSSLRNYSQADLQILVGNVQRPNALVWFDDDIFATCSGDFTIYQIDASSGQTITFASGVRDANSIWVETLETGFNLWIPDFDTNELLRASHLRGFPTPVVRENLDGPWGIAYLNEEEFLITNALSDTIVIANRDGSSRIIAEGFRYPTGIVVDDEFAYVANRGSARRAIEWFELEAIDPDAISQNLTQSLVSGLQNVSNLVLAEDGYLYFTYALAERGVVGRVQPTECREKDGCTNEDVEIVVLTDGRTAPLAGLTISPDMRLYVHTVYDSEIFWLQLYD